MWRCRLPEDFYEWTAKQALNSYGTATPDVRFDNGFVHLEKHIPNAILQEMTPLENPGLDAFYIHLGVQDETPPTPEEVIRLTNSMMSDPVAVQFHQNPSGRPLFFPVDPKAKQSGLTGLGEEAAQVLVDEWGLDGYDSDTICGDVIILQARAKEPCSFESTAAGRLRSFLLGKMMEMDPYYYNCVDYDFKWVIDHPMFRPIDSSTESTNIVSSHNPLASPKAFIDFMRMATEPLNAVADESRLIINGVLVCSGIRRIHEPTLQNAVLSDILKLPEDEVKKFNGIIKPLEAGCPPFSEFTIYVDDLAALLLDKHFVRMMPGRVNAEGRR